MKEKGIAIVTCVIAVAVVLGGFSFFIERNQKGVRIELKYTQQLEEEQRAQKEEQCKREERWLAQQTDPAIGMTKIQVKHIWGTPVEKRSGMITNSESWVYDGGWEAGGKYVWFKHEKVYIVCTAVEALREKRDTDRILRIGDETLAAWEQGNKYAHKKLQTLFINFSENEHVKEMSEEEFEELLKRLSSEEDPKVKREREAVKYWESQEEVIRQRELEERTEFWISVGSAREGMTKAQILRAWGQPKRIERTPNKQGINECWIYGDSLHDRRYFEGDICVKRNLF